MPTQLQTHLNPNDGGLYKGGFGQKKKSFLSVNQHYISSHAVLPAPYDLNEFLNSPYKNQPPKHLQADYNQEGAQNYGSQIRRKSEMMPAVSTRNVSEPKAQSVLADAALRSFDSRRGSGDNVTAAKASDFSI